MRRCPSLLAVPTNLVFALVALAAVCPSRVEATGYEHYPLGVEGIKAATVPPPGLYLREYLLYYNSDKVANPQGNDSGAGLDLDVFAATTRLIWVTSVKILEADLSMDFLVPLVYTDIQLKTPGLSDSEFGIGDVFIEPLTLAWHGDWWDAAVAAAVWIPTGNSGQLAAPGKGYWTGMFTFGGTVYFDPEKTWSLSVLGRYEIHSEQDNTRITPGDDLHFEWGLGKALMPGLEVGVAGFAHWQVTDDTGSGVTYDATVHDEVFAAGPEVILVIPETHILINARVLFEFEARDRTEGIRGVVVVTVPF